MKKYFLLLCLFIPYLTSKSNPVEFSYCTPESGSTITEWNFTLTFDITKALEACDGSSVGLGYMGSSVNNATLYKGSIDEGEALGIAMTSNFTGKSDGFKVNGNEVSFSFDSSISILDGQLYTVEIRNPFYLYNDGKATKVNSTLLDCREDPIVLTFYGGDTGGQQVRFDGSTIVDNSEYESILSADFNFYDEITVLDKSAIKLMEGETVYAVPSDVILSDDNKTIAVKFSEEIPLNYSHTYTMVIPEGTVALKDNTAVVNSLISYNLIGTKKYVYTLTSSGINKSSEGFINSVYMNFNLPDDKTLIVPDNLSVSSTYYGYLYLNTSESGESIATIKGSPTSDGKGIVWSLSGVSMQAGEKYVLQVNTLTNIFEKEGDVLQECSLAAETVEFTTPSSEEVALAPITQANFGSPIVQDTETAFEEGGTYESINFLEIEKLYYTYNSSSYTPYVRNNAKALLYDITDGNRTLIAEVTIADQRRELSTSYYWYAQLWLQSTFYQGHEYEIVIPANAFYIPDVLLKNYVDSEEFSYKLKGATPTSVSLDSKTIEDGDEISELTAMIWVFDGIFNLKDGATAKSSSNYIGSSESISQNELSAASSGGKTYVMANYVDKYTGKARTYSAEMECRITLPAGVVYYASDESICNEEIVTSFKGIPASSTEPEFVNTTVTLADNETNEAHSFIVKTVKDYPAEIQFLPGENWNVEDVAHEGTSLSAVNGVYTSEALTGDSKIVATLAYNKEMSFDQTTGVYSVEATDIKVYTESNQIVVSGLTEPTNIAVYSVGGILVKQLTTDAGYDMVRISAEPNEIYVVVINGQAAKVRL